MVIEGDTIIIGKQRFTPEQWNDAMCEILLERENALIDRSVLKHQITALAGSVSEHASVFSSIEEYVKWKRELDSISRRISELEDRLLDVNGVIDLKNGLIAEMVPFDVAIRIHDDALDEPGTYTVSWKRGQDGGLRPIVKVSFELDTPPVTETQSN